MSRLGERLMAAFYDRAQRGSELRGMSARRARLLSGARGTVLEIGAGTGLNVAHYPSGTELILTEPSASMLERLRERAGDARTVEAPASALPVDDASVDTVVSTLVLCSVEDLDASLREIARVLRPDGRFLFVEHVRSDDPRIARWQKRLRRPWAMFAGGCQLNRDTQAAIERHFAIEHVADEEWAGMSALVQRLAVGSARTKVS